MSRHRFWFLHKCEGPALPCPALPCPALPCMKWHVYSVHNSTSSCLWTYHAKPNVCCTYMQVPYCKGANASKDRASSCQQQEAQDRCRRSCNLSHPKIDTSSLVWYNQRSSLLRQQGEQVENITDSIQLQQGAIDPAQQRLVLSLLEQITPAAPKDRKAAARGNSPQSMEEFKTCIGNPFWVPLCISVVFLTSMACLVKRSCRLKQQRPSRLTE